MSDKKAKIQLHSDSQIPKDLLVPTLGSNYGMDGFEDMEYGMGVLEGVLDPEYHQPPALPTGLNKGADMDLSSALEDESGLADLSWLADAGQDPERLPQSPVDLGIPELEQAWGVDRRTNGVTVFAKDLDTARYEQSLEEDAQRLTRSASELEGIIVRAMRRSAMGHSLKEILVEAAAKSGSDAHRISKAMRMVSDEHGLVGNVFIRSAAFPGIAKGKWSTAERKATKLAKYIVVSERDFGSTRIQNGNCTLTGKKAVLSVPWDEALQHYRPLLRVSGRNPEGKNAKHALRTAFLTTPSGPKSDGSSLPVYIQESVSSEEARTSLKEATAIRSVVEVSEAHVQARIASWESAGMITPGIAQSILASKRTPNEKLDAALMVVKAVEKKAFSGAPNQAVDAAQERQSARLANLNARTEDRETKLARTASLKRSQDLDRRVAMVIEQIERGARGEMLKTIVGRLIPDEYAAEAVRRLAPAIKKANAMEEGSETASYSGPVFERAQPNRTAVELSVPDAIVKAANTAGVKVAEIRGVLRWARQNMSEGFAGKELDDLLAGRFSKSVLTASEDLIAGLRTDHEGLAGFMYVDAEAYASPSGISGCEKGGTRHRANQITSVLEMPKCQGCTRARQMEDGTMKCAVYNKMIVPRETLADPEIQQLRRANIEAVGMTDAEATAAIFTPSTTYDAAEYNLRNAEMTELTLDSFAETKAIEQVSFGGFTWE